MQCLGCRPCCLAHAATSGGGACSHGVLACMGWRWCRYLAVEKPKEGGGEAWASIWQGPSHVFFGHDAKRRLQLHAGATGLDTSCVYGGQLTAAVLPPLPLRPAAGHAAQGDGGAGAAGPEHAGTPQRAPTREELGVELVAVEAMVVHDAPGGGAAAAPAAEEEEEEEATPPAA